MLNLQTWNLGHSLAPSPRRREGLPPPPAPPLDRPTAHRQLLGIGSCTPGPESRDRRAAWSTPPHHRPLVGNADHRCLHEVFSRRSPYGVAVALAAFLGTAPLTIRMLALGFAAVLFSSARFFRLEAYRSLHRARSGSAAAP